MTHGIYELSHDFCVIDLVGDDVVMDAQWLKTLTIRK
jgi:hypothetical protein